MNCFWISFLWKHQCFCFHYWHYLTNIWRNNWRSIFDGVEGLDYCLEKGLNSNLKFKIFQIFFSSSRQSSRQDCANDGKWGARSLPQITGNLPTAANFARIGSAAKNMRRYPWSIYWPIEAVWIRWVPARVQLFIPGRLCRSWKTEFGVNLSPACVQDKIARKFLPAKRKPWVCQY